MRRCPWSGFFKNIEKATKHSISQLKAHKFQYERRRIRTVYSVYSFVAFVKERLFHQISFCPRKEVILSVVHMLHRREDRRLTFGNTFRQLPTSHSGHPGDLCVPRLPGMKGFVDQWMELTLKNFSLNTSCNATKCWVGGDEPRPLKVSQRR